MVALVELLAPLWHAWHGIDPPHWHGHWYTACWESLPGQPVLWESLACTAGIGSIQTGWLLHSGGLEGDILPSDLSRILRWLDLRGNLFLLKVCALHFLVVQLF